MRLPEGPEDGAVPLDRVKRVLVEQGVRLKEMGDVTIMAKDGTIQAQRFTDPVNRALLQQLYRIFDFEYVAFYYDQTED